MNEIKLEKRYPHSRTEDITDAFIRGYEQGRTHWASVLAELHDRFDALEKELRKASAEMSAIIREYVDRPQGEWIVYEGGWKDLDYYPSKCKCDQCGYEEELYILNAKPTNFCPNCGADMRERKESE